MLEAVAKHHRKHHRVGSWLPRVGDCRRCQESKERCKIKRVYGSRAAADKEALRINQEVRWWPDECKYAYRCMWCAKWHLTTATRPGDTRRIEKMYARWARKTGRKVVEAEVDPSRLAKGKSNLYFEFDLEGEEWLDEWIDDEDKEE